MKLSTFAKQTGINYTTAWRWCKNDTMPCPWEQTETGTIIVYPKKQRSNNITNTYTYSRVSSYPKKEDLKRQVKCCCEFCEASGWTVTKSFKEIASGMNDNRKQLNKLFNLDPARLVVEHKDRLTRFGFNYIETLLTKLGWEIIVINRDEEETEDLMKDLISIITSFCCKLYGLRRGKNKAKKVTKQCVEPAN